MYANIYLYLVVISVANSSRRLWVPVRLNSCHNSVKDWSLVVILTLLQQENTCLIINE